MFNLAKPTHGNCTFTVALIGPDGAGKTTVCRRLLKNSPVPVRYLYMGINTDASNVMLPTTRLLRTVRRLCGKQPDAGGPRDRRREPPRPAGTARRVASSVRNGLRLIHMLVEEWYRQFTAWWYMARGYVVVCDRHFLLDYYHYDIAGDDGPPPLHRRLHGLMLNHLYPRPGVVILLDAPAEVLFARKGEGTIEVLDERRKQYYSLRKAFEHFHVVDATEDLEDVAGRVAGLVREHYCRRHSLVGGSAGDPCCLSTCPSQRADAENAGSLSNL